MGDQDQEAGSSLEDIEVLPQGRYPRGGGFVEQDRLRATRQFAGDGNTVVFATGDGRGLEGYLLDGVVLACGVGV